MTVGKGSMDISVIQGAKAVYIGLPPSEHD